MDFWGAVMPAWIGALGGVISAVVGGVALISSLRTRGGVNQLRDGINANEAAPVQYTASLDLSSEGTLSAEGEPGPAYTAEATTSGEGNTTATASVHVAVVWSAERDSNRYVLFNRSSTHPARVIALGPAREGNGVRPLIPLPIDVPAGGWIPFAIDRRFTGPAVTGVMITWEEEGMATQTNVVYV